MKIEKVITVLSDKEKRFAERKGPVRPSKVKHPLARRLRVPQIRFWDLAQVNHEDLNDEPVWSDHPILKTPSYTTEHDIWGGNNFAGVRYLLEAFDSSDFQDYTDMMFQYPVNEWKQRYRRIEGIDDYGNPETDDFRFDMRFSLKDSSYSSTAERFCASRILSRSFLGQPTFDTQKEAYLTSYHFYWDNDRSYAGYRDLDQITGQYNPRNGFGDNISGGFFPYSTDNELFKVTATNDPDASAVDIGEPSGVYDVFLMPQIGFFMATANSADWKTTEVLGLCYQVMPRYLWPRYVEGLQTGTGGQYGSDAAVSSWFNYQQARLGNQFSTWVYTGTGSGGSYSYTESPGVPADWTGLAQWGAAMNGDDVPNFVEGVGGYYYSKSARGAPTMDNVPTYNTLFAASTSDPNFGDTLFRNDEPFLTAVIQKGGQFYYVWDISHAVEGFGNYSCSELIDQHDRFRLSRGIDWEPGYIDQSPPQPRDGTGPFFDY